MRKIIHFAAMLFALTVAFAPVMSAQVTTSTLSGRVVDEEGNPLPGAAVVAVHTLSGSQYYDMANEGGYFSISGMRPGGPYMITVSLIGYKNFQKKDQTFPVGETGGFKASLEEDSFALEGAVLVETTDDFANRTGAAHSFYSRQIQEIPSIDHGVGDVVKLSPYVSVGSDGSITIAGANYKYNSFLIDGVSNTDVFGLTSNGFNGGLAGSQPLSMETVEQMQVMVSPFDIRHSGFTGGGLNAVTKSGTNDFHGSFYINGDTHWMCGNKYTMLDGTASPKLSERLHYRAGLTAGGALLKNRLFFFLNYERVASRQPNAYGPGSPVSYVDSNLAESLLNTLREMASSQGVDYSGGLLSSYLENTSSDKASLKMDWNIDRKHHFSLRWGIVAARKPNKTSTPSSLVSSDYTYTYKSMTNNVVMELQSHLDNGIHNEFRASYVDVRDRRSPCGDPFPNIEISNVGNGRLSLGNENSSVANRLDQNIATVTDNLNVSVGSHTVTIGSQNDFYRFSNLFIRYLYGTYKFNSPEDFIGGNIAEYYYGHANEKVTGNPLWAPSFTSAQFGLYLQDKWKVNPAFTILYALRADVPVFFVTPDANPEFNAYAAERSWNLRTDSKVAPKPLLSPRIGFRVDMAKDGKYIMRGGAGVFTGTAPFVWFMSKYSDTGVQKTSISARNPSGISVILDPHGQGVNEAKLAPDGAQSVTVSNPDLKMPQTLRADLAFDLCLGGIDWTLEGVFSKKLNDISYQQLAYEPTGKTVGELMPWMAYDTRPVYAKTSPEKFNNIYCITNNGDGYSYNLVASARKSFDFGLEFNASYTYSRSLSTFESFSTTSESNFCANLTHSDPNNPEMGCSFFNQPHQVKAALTYRKSYGRDSKFLTAFSLIYTGYSGSPYSLYYNGDLNGDSSPYNDLIFIPTDEQVDMMQFKPTGTFTVETQRRNLKEWLASTPYLKDHRGQYFDRYAANMPFEHHLDFHFSQKFFFEQKYSVHCLELTLDILNLGNMFNPAWGRTYTTLLANTSAFSPITYDSKGGKFQFLRDKSYNMFSCDDTFSRWRAQVGVKYTF